MVAMDGALSVEPDRRLVTTAGKLVLMTSREEPIDLEGQNKAPDEKKI